MPTAIGSVFGTKPNWHDFEGTSQFNTVIKHGARFTVCQAHLMHCDLATDGLSIAIYNIDCTEIDIYEMTN